LQAAVSVGATVLGALFGRKIGSARNVGRATTAARGVGRTSRERGDVRRARERVASEEQKLRELERELEEHLAKLREEHDPAHAEIEVLEIPPRKSDLSVERLALAWAPPR
jgi:C4-dicarboxylate-specific signal transduction histidine kinase